MKENEIKQAFIESGLPANHWSTWVAAVKWTLGFSQNTAEFEILKLDIETAKRLGK